MINGVNSVDFNFAKEGKTSIPASLPQARSDLITVLQYAYAKPELTLTARNLTKVNKMELPPTGLERVHVQHLQTHTQLRNNKWTYQNFYSNATQAGATASKPNEMHPTQYNHSNSSSSNNNISTSHNNNNKINNNNNSNNNINNNNNNDNNKLNKNIYDNKSALIKCNSTVEQLRHEQVELNSALIIGGGEPKQNDSDSFMLNGGDKITIDGDNGNSRPNYNRTKDQENAFRCIEDVHNYAKLTRYGNSNESSDGSLRDFDDDDDDDDDEDDDEDDDIDDIHGVNGDNDYVESVVKKQAAKNLANASKSHVISVGAGFLQTKKSNAKTFTRTPSKSSSNEDNDAIVDVETVPIDSVQQLMQSPPAHHARRPMNAFLIFCKRHRAIVKDRYKSLENRAITKILGDWWASLDNNEKECFTKLAQQNKDAFFSAHPNFKWYKLPAPPLRTLSTRPTNAEQRALEGGNENDTTDEPMKMATKQQAGGFFKLADEAQMGELNSLIIERNQCECPLQKALGETTHFLSAHMPNAGINHENNGDFHEKPHIKRRAITESSFSSNSSEDDVLPKKSSRSCKGKIYQELVSSGQIAPIAKKTKQPKVANAAGILNNDMQAGDFNYTANLHDGFNAASYLRAMDMRNSKAKRAFSESDAGSQHQQQPFGEHIGEQFDLEEKIKQLPALSLDAYLQRKRNTKKKKKFTTKKRNSNSVSLPITGHQHQRPNALVATAPIAPKNDLRAYVQKQQQKQQQQAVGSQKRKARKESITRRDLSAIESEVASMMPLATNYDLPNGHYYYDDKPSATPTATATTTTTLNVNAANTGSENASGALSNYADSITTTSDLFILAEVAAKRTEITNQH